MDPRRTFLFPLLILIGASSVHAKAWRGIEPLRSSRADVIRSFNQCADQSEACVFTVDNEDIYIGFFAGLIAESIRCLGEVAPDTVMFIESRPHSSKAFHDFQFVKRDFTKSSLESYWKLRRPVKFDVYISDKDGLALKAREGKVVQAVYLPSSSDIHRCRYYYGTLDRFVYIWEGHVPAAIAGCPQETVFEQQQITVVVTTDIPTRTGFSWKISDGKIVAGQHTPRIRIDTTGLGGKSIEVSVEVTDRDLELTTAAMCKVAISKRP